MSNIHHMTVEDLELVSGQKLLLNVDIKGTKVADWLTEYRSDLDRLVSANGVLLIRGLNIMSSKQFGVLLEQLFDEQLINYSYRSTPRTELKGNVYTATEYHASETIPQHNENAYSNQWPMRLGFLCLLPSAVGGNTPLADSRQVYEAIDPDIRQEFESKQVMYVRNYDDIDLPWSEVFQTTERDDVEVYCRKNQIHFEWGDNNRLRTWQINQASERHPVTGEKVWFNQAHLFHVSNLSEQVRKDLLAMMDEKDLPRNSYFGDGSAIDAGMLDHIRGVYAEHLIEFPWQRQDLLLLDNMLYTHGRRPFEGNRKILVGMARPYGGSASSSQ